jgi:hypothetical protein
MAHEDAELSDVEVVLADDVKLNVAEAAEEMKKVGLFVEDTDEENRVVEGTIEEAKVGDLKKLPFVKYVRIVFTYIADYPPGDPRNLDGDDDELSSEADDAGA